MHLFTSSPTRRGATLVEYGLIAALVAMVAIAAVSALGGSANTTFTDTNTALNGGAPAGPSGPTVVFSGEFSTACTLGGDWDTTPNCPTAVFDSNSSDMWPVTAGVTYEVTITASTEPGGNTNIDIEWYDSGALLIEDEDLTPSGALSTPTEYTYQFTAPPGATHVLIWDASIDGYIHALEIVALP